MTELHRRWAESTTRRNALQALAGVLGGSPLLEGQQDPFRDHSRVPGLAEMVTAFDFEPVLFAKVPKFAYDYTAYGTDSEFTLRRNREAYDWVELVPNKASDATPVQTATEVLGTKMAFPIMVAPSSGHGLLHPDGELATCKGAAAASQTPFIVSNGSSQPYEKVVAAASTPMWAQIYPKESADENKLFLDRVQTAGTRAVVVTMDEQAAEHERILHDQNLTTTRPATRRVTPKNAYRLPEYRLWYTWKYFDMIRPMVKVPLLAKGVLTAEDAKQCLEHGVDGIYVSNHGGRSVDYAPSSLEVLPEIVSAVGGKVPILFDSGVRRGSDVLKALALGAIVVCLGRVPRWGLGAYGALGVQKSIEIIQAELVAAMAYTGRSSVASIDHTIVRKDFA